MPVSVSVIDGFNRANAANLGADWTGRPFADGASDLQIISNQAGSTSGYSYVWYELGSWNPASGTVEVAINIPVLPPNNGIVFLSLLQAPDTGSATGFAYQAVLTINTGGNDTVAVERIDAGGGFASLASAATLNWAAGDTLIMRLTAAGVITVVKDTAGVESTALSLTNTTYTGAFFYGTGTASDSGITRLDNPAAGNLGGATPSGSATSTVGLTSSATGRRVGQRAVTTTAALTSSETGRRVGQRSAFTALGLTSTATGRRVGRRSAATAVGLASAATGLNGTIETHSGSAASTFALTSTASGRRVSRAAPATTIGVQSTATARRISQASHEEASALPPFTTIVAGALTTTGLTSTGSGTASSVETHAGAAASTVGLSSAATGRRVSRGTAATSAGITSSASARRVSRGVAASTAAFTSTSSQRRVSRGACTSVVGLSSSGSGTSSGVPTRNGSGSTLVGLTSTGSGRRSGRGSCSTIFGASSVARGLKPLAGSPVPIVREAVAGLLSWRE